MCDSCNKPNCGCSPCQECNNPVPQQTCTTTCTCTTDQFSQDCPCGQVGTNCIIYTGDELLDCQDDPFISRGSSFNTVLSDIWDYVKCAAAPTTDTIDYTGADIKTCDNNTTIVPTNTPVTTALNNIWNYIKCWYTDLVVLINNRQPVWKAGYPILVDASLFAPFNDINTAITEITKYHHDVNGPVRVRLGNGAHTLNAATFGNWNSQSGSFQLESNGPWNANLNIPNGLIIDSFNLILKELAVFGSITVTNKGNLLSNNCNHFSFENTTNLITVSNSSSATFLESALFGNLTGLLTPTGILVENNSSVNIITTQRQNEFFANFTTLFDVTDNSSLFLEKNAVTQDMGTRIGTILNLNNNSRASIVGSTSEFNAPTPLLTSYEAFNITNNSELYLENTQIGGYQNPFNIENNSKVVFGGTIDFNTATRINVFNNSLFLGKPNSTLIGNLNNTGSAFALNGDSTINLFNSIVTFTNVSNPNYTLRNNSKAIFKSGAILPIPTSGNSIWGDNSTSVVINNIVNTSANINSIGCGVLIYNP